MYLFLASSLSRSAKSMVAGSPAPCDGAELLWRVGRGVPLDEGMPDDGRLRGDAVALVTCSASLGTATRGDDAMVAMGGGWKSERKGREREREGEG